MNSRSYNFRMHKVEINAKLIGDISHLFAVLKDQTRLKIMFSLLDESLCVCQCDNCGECPHLCCMIKKCVNDIAFLVQKEQSLISHQLHYLKKHGLVRSEKVKNKVFYSLKDGHVKQLLKIALEHIME